VLKTGKGLPLMKRDVHMYEKRPAFVWKKTYINMKRYRNTNKTYIYIYEKRLNTHIIEKYRKGQLTVSRME